MPHPVDCHGSSYNGKKLHVLGGRYRENGQNKHEYSSVNVLDLATLSWEECQSLPIAVSGPGIAAVEKNIYALGGYTGNEWSRQTIKLNTQTGRITQCQNMPKGDSVHNSTLTVNQCIYALAGTIFLQYDTKRDHWTKLTNSLKPCHAPTMVLKENHLIMLGGFEKDEKNPNDTIQEYDLSSQTWSLEARKMPLPLTYHWAFVMEIPQEQ